MSKLKLMLEDLEGLVAAEGKEDAGEIQRLAMNLQGALISKGWRKAKSTSRSTVNLSQDITPETQKKTRLAAWQLLKKAGFTAERGTGSTEHGKEKTGDGVSYYYSHPKHSMLSASIFTPKSNERVIVSITDWAK